MKLGKTGRWLITAFGVFLGLLVIWVLAVLQLNPAGAGVLNLGFDVRSRLPADYGPDTASRQVGVLRFTIIGDVMRELGMGPEEAEGYAEGMQVAMSGPVPTATARDFSGADPFTATPTLTPIPTDTPEPTATPVPTRTRRPTHTPRPTETNAPTAVAVTAAPTATGDTEAPEICCFETEPEPGPLTTCTIAVDELEIFDPGPSSGIQEVMLKYNHATDGWIMTPATLDDGDWESGPGSAWRAHYSGSITISGVSIAGLGPGGMARMASVVERSRATTGVVTIEVKVRVVDNAGHTTDSDSLYFDLTVSCP